MSGGRIVVVGGGLSGIATALSCAREGASVTLIESRGRLGGAAYSFDRHGIHADNGQHVFLRCCVAYRELLNELDASEMVALQPRLDIPILAPGGRRARLRRDGLPAPMHLGRALLGYPLLTMRERAAAAVAMRALRAVDPDDPANDERSFGEWLREHGQSEQTVEAIWSLIVRPTVNLRPDDASLAQAAQVFQVGLLEDAASGDVGYATVPLSEIHDRAAQRALNRAGVKVILRRGASDISGHRGAFCIESSGAPTLEADVVVLAVSPDRAARLLPPVAGVARSSLEALGSSPIVNLHIVLDRPVLKVPFAAGVHTPVQWVFDRTSSAGIDSGQYLAVTLSAADEELEMTVDELRGRYLPALAELLPEVDAATVREFFVTREHSATFRAAPGARALRPGPVTALPGLLLAGSWTATGWPATMESAVRSGRAAAREALAALAGLAAPAAPGDVPPQSEAPKVKEPV